MIGMAKKKHEPQKITPAAAGEGAAAARVLGNLDATATDHDERIVELEERGPGGAGIAFARDDDGRAYDPGRTV
jgi:hypothetical protein